MTDFQVQVIKEMIPNAYWAPDDSTFRKVVCVLLDYDDEGPCAFFQNGQYAALENCDVSDFVYAKRLKDNGS